MAVEIGLEAEVGVEREVGLEVESGEVYGHWSPTDATKSAGAT